MSDAAPVLDDATTITRTTATLPRVLILSEVAAYLGVKLSRAYQLEQAGELAPFECLPRIGNRARYSGKKLQAWADGPADAGTAPRSRYFGSGRAK